MNACPKPSNHLPVYLSIYPLSIECNIHMSIYQSLYPSIALLDRVAHVENYNKPRNRMSSCAFLPVFLAVVFGPELSNGLWEISWVMQACFHSSQRRNQPWGHTAAHWESKVRSQGDRSTLHAEEIPDTQETILWPVIANALVVHYASTL